MGSPGPSSESTWTVLTLVLVIILSSMVIAAPRAEAAAGDLLAPVYSDGDWWNYTVSGPHPLPTRSGDYDVDFERAQGWIRLEVDGTTSHMGSVAWVMKVTGKVRFNGDWSGGEDTGLRSKGFPARNFLPHRDDRGR